jgi:outer membrane lipoprotein-sorting protein
MTPGNRSEQPERLSPSFRGPAGPWVRLGTVAFAGLMLLAGTGCLSVRTRVVGHTIVENRILDATLDQLLSGLAAQDAAIQSLNASINITASTGGEHEGQVKEIPTFAGYIFMRRPMDLRVLMLVPVLRSTALDMVSDGKQFKLSVPSKNMAITGADRVTTTGKNGLANLRPYIVRDALLIPTAGPDEYVTLTKGSRITPPAPGQKDSIEEPDYDLAILRNTKDHVLEQVRVIHFGRMTLKPYQQDIYDMEGRVVTTVTYAKYQKFGDLDFPGTITITRPIDEYKLKIDVTKLAFNQKLDDEQFVLPFPAGVPVQTM